MDKFIYLAIDADFAGRQVGRAVLANDESRLHEISSNINLGQDIIKEWAESHGGSLISAGGDEGTLKVPAEALQDVERLRKDYHFSTGLTITVGVGNSLSEAGKSLIAGKIRGKDQVVQYDESVEQDIKSAHERVESGEGSEEEKKLDEAYISEDKKPEENDMAREKEKERENEKEGEKRDQKDEGANEETSGKDEEVDAMDHLSDKELAKDLEEREIEEEREKQVPGDMGLSEDAEDTEEATEESGEEEAENGEDAMEEETEENPDSMAEDSQTEESPDFTEILREGLEEQADSINKEKVINMVSQALEGFKNNKEILERAKEKAPELYNSSIAMLKAMIEMAKMLGLAEEAGEETAETEMEAEAGEMVEPSEPATEAAAQEDAAEDPKKFRQ